MWNRTDTHCTSKNLGVVIKPNSLADCVTGALDVGARYFTVTVSKKGDPKKCFVKQACLTTCLSTCPSTCLTHRSKHMSKHMS